MLNLSVSGYSVEQYWLYLRRVLPSTQPKLIMVGVFTGNNLQLTGRELTPWGHGEPLFVVEGATGSFTTPPRTASTASRRACSSAACGVTGRAPSP